MGGKKSNEGNNEARKPNTDNNVTIIKNESDRPRIHVYRDEDGNMKQIIIPPHSSIEIGKGGK